MSRTDEIRRLIEEAVQLSFFDAQRARALADRAYFEAESLGDRPLVAHALQARAAAHYSMGHLEPALADGSQALAIFSVLPLKSGQAASLRLLGEIETQLGNFHDATLYFEEGRELATTLEDPDFLARFNYSLGLANLRLHQPLEGLPFAREFYTKAALLQPHDQFLARLLLANLCLQVAEHQMKRGRVQEAQTSLMEAHLFAQETAEIIPEQSGADATVEAWGILTKIQAMLLMRTEAIEGLTRLQDALKFVGQDMTRARGHLLEAEILAALGEHLPAIQSGMQALTLFQNSKSMVDVCETLGRLADYCEKVGDIRAAFDYYKRYRDMDDEIRTRSAERRSQLLSRKMDLERTRHEAEILKLKSELLSQQNVSLQQMADRHLEQALQDQLTGLPNRRAYDEMAERLEAGTQWPNLPISVVVCDIDHFKRVNDTHGHAIGDEVLQKFAEVLGHAVRDGDFVARIGGEEFVILMRGAFGQTAVGASNRIRMKIEQADWSSIHPDLRVTSCFGVASAEGERDMTVLLEQADRALYEAKNTGRNRVCFAALDE